MPPRAFGCMSLLLHPKLIFFHNIQHLCETLAHLHTKAHVFFCLWHQITFQRPRASCSALTERKLILRPGYRCSFYLMCSVLARGIHSSRLLYENIYSRFLSKGTVRRVLLRAEGWAWPFGANTSRFLLRGSGGASHSGAVQALVWEHKNRRDPDTC